MGITAGSCILRGAGGGAAVGDRGVRRSRIPAHSLSKGTRMSGLKGFVGPVIVLGAIAAAAALCPMRLCHGGSCGAVAYAAAQDKPACPATSNTQDKKGDSNKEASKTDTPGCCQKGSTTGGTCCSQAAKSAAGGCPKDALRQSVLAGQPSMSLRVDGQTITCPVEAEQTSKASGKPVEYVVASAAFPDKSAASAKLTTLVDEYATGLLSMRFAVGEECFQCPVTADEAAKKAQSAIKFRVAGVDFDTKEAALAALEAAKKAAAESKMSFKVGDKVFPTAPEASQAAVTSNSRVTYVIGTVEATDEVSAKLALAQARVEAIVTAAVEARFGAIASAAGPGR